MSTALTYTIFSDLARREVRQVVTLDGDAAEAAIDRFRNLHGRRPRQGEVIAGCRIDQITVGDT